MARRKRQPKIVVIGAASMSFTGLLADLINAAELDGARFELVDIDADGLAVAEALGRRMARQWNSSCKITATTDRREALEGADFVLTTIAVGGVETWRQDHDIPLKHGYYGHAVDTVGAGGLFRALRLIPPMIDICRDVEQLCPDAWVINYSNPIAGICRAVRKTTSVNIVGLCTAGFLPAQVARRLEISPDRVEVVSGGLNHCVWALKIIVDGEDYTDRWHAKMRELRGDGWVLPAVELLDVFGVWPFPGASHVAEFFPYFYPPGDDGREDGRYPFRKPVAFDKRIERDAERRESRKAQAEGRRPIEDKPEESAGEAVRMLVSIWNDAGTRHYANVQNEGLISNMPDEAIVEIPVVAGSAGVRGIKVGPLPASIVGFMQARWACYELLAEAAIKRSKRLALQCLCADPLTSSLSRARECIEEMFEAQAKYLPGYE